MNTEINPIPLSPVEKNDLTQDPVKEKPAEENLILLPTPREIMGLLSKKVMGHDHAKRTVAVAVYQHLMQCAKSDVIGDRVEGENHVLLAGNSGTGKSLLMRTLGEVLGLPIYYVPCTNITPNGYRGKNFTQYVDEIKEYIVNDGYTKPAIIVWDEIDKLSLHNNLDSQAMVYLKMTQMDFLTFLDGGKCGDDNEMDSSRILSIACGAFVGIDKIRNKKEKPIIGFQSSVGLIAQTDVPLRPEHFVEYGLMTELVGRFSRICSLDPLDRSVMRKILLDADNNVLERRKDFFEIHGVRLEVTDDAIDALIDKAMTHKTGARALRLVIDQVLHGVEHRLPDMAQEGISALIIDKDVVLGKSLPIECKGENTQSKAALNTLRNAALFYKSSKKPSENSLSI